MPRKNAKKRFDYEKTEPLTDLSFDSEITEPLTDFSLIPCYDHPQGKILDVPVKNYEENPRPKQAGSTDPVAENDTTSGTMADAERSIDKFHESGEMLMAVGSGDGMPVVNSKQFQNSNVIVNAQSQVQDNGLSTPKRSAVLGEASNDEPLIPPSPEVQVDAARDTSTFQEPKAEGTCSSSGNDFTPIANLDSIVSLDPNGNGNVEQEADFIPEIIQPGPEVSSPSTTPSTSQISIDIAYETGDVIIDKDNYQEIEFSEAQAGVKNDEHKAYPPAIETGYRLVLVSDESEQDSMFHADAEMETLEQELEFAAENLPESDTSTLCPHEQIKDTGIFESQRKDENMEFPAVLSPVDMEQHPPHNYDESSTSTRVGLVFERNETESDTATEVEGLGQELKFVEKTLSELGSGTSNVDPGEPIPETEITEAEDSVIIGQLVFYKRSHS